MKRGEWVRCYGGYGAIVNGTVLLPGAYYELRCFRCDERAQLLLPAPMTPAAAFIKAFGKSHERCRQTLLGARWALTHLLHVRKYRLERGEAG